MGALADFQDGFVAALAAAKSPRLLGAIARLERQPAFSVYRNTVMKGWLDALEANFPAVVRLVGLEWFRAAAAVYARRHPPHQPALILYGDDLPSFLEGFEPAADLPYLPSVARLDRLHTETHVAPDAEPMPAHVIALLGPERLAEAAITLHPSIRIAWFDHNAPTIWFQNRGFAPPAEALEFTAGGEGALLVRVEGAVRAVPLGAGGHAFLVACGRGRRFAEAVEAASLAEPGADVGAFLAQCLALGVFHSLDLSTAQAS